MAGAGVNIRVSLFGLTIITWEIRDSLSQILAGHPKSENRFNLFGFIGENNSAEYACFQMAVGLSTVFIMTCNIVILKGFSQRFLLSVRLLLWRVSQLPISKKKHREIFAGTCTSRRDF